MNKKILWVTNIILPPVCEYFSLPSSVFGGWLFSSLNKVKEISEDFDFAVASLYKGNELKKISLHGVSYYLVPQRYGMDRYDPKLAKFFKDIGVEFKPDLIHIHGTEYPHAFTCTEAFPNVKKLATIQGLVSVYARYYLAGLDIREIIRSFSFGDLINKSILSEFKAFKKKSIFEEKTLRAVDFIQGRTEWDRAHAYAINSKATYKHCNETLRPIFYKKKWEYDLCEVETIFVSQASYPIKGLHYLLKAMPLILREFPRTKIRIAGPDIIHPKSFSRKIKFCGYPNYIKKLIGKLGLQDKVEFLGLLNEDEICQAYLRSNVFVSLASIENSANSIGEAQLLGMPIVASYVGGTPDMMQGYEEWMYRYNDPEILAFKIIEIFKKKNKVDFRNSSSRIRHDPILNAKRQIEIYKEILS